MIIILISAFLKKINMCKHDNLIEKEINLSFRKRKKMINNSIVFKTELENLKNF